MCHLVVVESDCNIIMYVVIVCVYKMLYNNFFFRAIKTNILLKMKAKRPYMIAIPSLENCHNGKYAYKSFSLIISLSHAIKSTWCRETKRTNITKRNLNMCGIENYYELFVSKLVQCSCIVCYVYYMCASESHGKKVL